MTAAAGPLGVWCNALVDLTLTAFSAAKSLAVMATKFRVDGAPWALGEAVTVAAPADDSNAGLHAIRYRSVDRYLDDENAKVRMVGIDTLGPAGAPDPQGRERREGVGARPSVRADAQGRVVEPALLV